MRMLKVVIVLVCAFVGVQGRMALGGCPAVTVKSDMDFSKFVGSWFEVSRYPSMDQGLTYCSFYFLNLQQGGTVIMFDLTSTDRFTDETTNDQANFNITGTSGTLTRNDGYDISVLDTDNDSYAVLYSCEDRSVFNIFPYRREFLWILSRSDTGFDEATSTAVEGVLSANGLPLWPLRATSQEGCE